MRNLPPIQALMSPPESKPHDRFTPPRKSNSPPYHQYPTFDSDRKLAPMGSLQHPQTPVSMTVLPSPPTSPWVNSKAHGQKLEGLGHSDHEPGSLCDPVLYPHAKDAATSIASQPLFPVEPPIEDVISNHMKMKVQRVQGKVVQPTHEEYRLVLSCVSNLGKTYNANPGRFLKRTLEDMENQYWRTKRIRGEPGCKAGVRPVTIAPSLVASPKQPKKPIKSMAGTNSAPRVRRPPKSSPANKQLSSPHAKLSTLEYRHQPQKRPEDVDYMALPDYAPPLSTLPAGNAKALKADWSSTNVLDLSDDPDKHMLHEAEVNLAATLRLSCATYLCSKRRIFEACVTHYLNGKPDFRKTNAQQACKIDVNKASKLWTAYDRVGWFNKTHFQKWL